MNAIAQAAASGTPIGGCAIYCTHEPCSMCSKLLINAGCKRAIYMYPYPDDLSRALRDEAGLESAARGDDAQVTRILSIAASAMNAR
jgi:dCMP deaminase